MEFLIGKNIETLSFEKEKCSKKEHFDSIKW
jgi:hypothetical protein